ncbi:hypothetical protein VIBNISOn1_p0160 [Vibrio nigripulchritudo SOn1]|uniref:ParE-like toxin domain-containing protein n=1 Tax=Vibrio nigripulchritudo SOn1 TaxID=1238450 RepID=A0AAV2W236_9VIBR|nr:hypothetical protein VIBNISOn1_p0160 [Vibrio nigripulchritudo SOn1]
MPFSMHIDIPPTFGYIYMRKITLQCNPVMNTASVRYVCLIDVKIWRLLPKSEQSKTREVMSAVASGTPFSSLGGKILKFAPSLVRFKIGRSSRLVLSKHKHRFEFSLCPRQSFDKHIMCLNASKSMCHYLR